MKQGLTPLWTKDMVEDWYSRFTDKAEEKIIRLLSASGELFVRIARLYGNYKDKSGNLRSSIGYVIAKDGKIIASNFEVSPNGTEKAKGLKRAKQLADEVSKLYNGGYVLIGVAGMDYAACVEARGYDVVSKACIQCEDYLRRASKRIFDRLYG